MKKQFIRKVFASILAGALIVSSAHVPVNAQTGKTIAGPQETVNLGAEIEATRDNDFNKEWKFYLGTSSSAHEISFNDSSWETVNLPHDFSIFQSFTLSGEAESGFLPGGTGWYRKDFRMEESMKDKTVMLEFDGVYSDAYVYVNGTYVGEHHYGYTDFAFDISEHLIFDGLTENVIAVKAVNNIPTSRWYSGSGIYRDVKLSVIDKVHVDYNGTYITTPNIKNGNGTVNVSVDVVNNGSGNASVTVKNDVYKKGSAAVVATASTVIEVAAGAKATATTTPVVAAPELWSIENPNLYTVHTTLQVAGTTVDEYDTEFGFRYIEYNSSGFHLNGQAVKLNGVCLHHDQGALGSAAYYDAMYRQLSIMKDMGCNAIRTSHNPADEDFIKICNELGLVVFEEVFDGLVDPKNSNNNDFSKYFEKSLGEANGLYNGTANMTNAEFVTKSIVKRDRNHPSIIAWSFGNEIQEGTNWSNVSRYDDIAGNFISWVNALDATRPVTSGDNNRGGDSALVDVINTITNAGGIAGFNYANSIDTLRNLANRFGGQKGMIVASETASATNSRGMYMSQSDNSMVDGKYHLTSYDTSKVHWGLTAHDSIYNTYNLDNVAGEFVWTGFDYIGEPTPWNGTNTGQAEGGNGTTPNSSYFGIVETTGFEKDTYYLYRSQWNKEETTLHLVTAWDADNMMNQNGKTPVWVYSNAPVVKLYRGETLVGTATRHDNTSAAGHTYYTYTTESNDSNLCTTSSGSNADGLYAIFNVAYEAGTLSAKAYEADGTTEIKLSGNSGKNTVTTPGTVSKLAVSQNKTEIQADGSSLAYITVDVTDANGNLDTTAVNDIQFTLSGEGTIAGVDNGDQATNEKYQQTVSSDSKNARIKAYAGKALVIVRSTEDAGTITLNVSSSGMTGQTVTVRTVKDNGDAQASGLLSYTMVRDYTVKEGTEPTLATSATGTMADGSTVTGNITWETVTVDVYGKTGDYVVKGSLVFDGQEPIDVSASLHVIANVVAMRNISTVTEVGTVPELPKVVKGVLVDGTLSQEFSVTWDMMNADQFATVDDIVVINGQAAVFGDETLPVTCSVRVAKAVNKESVNVAPMADSLSQNINGSDVLMSIKNGVLKPGDNTNERWSNWGNRTTSASATLTFTWATAQTLSGVELYYYYDNCAAKPEKVEFLYSANSVDFVAIGSTETEAETYSMGGHYSYTFDKPINPVALSIKLTQQDGTTGAHCVALTEAEIMTFAGAVETNDSADLTGIMVDGTAISGFAADTYHYEMDGTTVSAAATENAGVTVLPVYEGVVRILTVSEDGSAAKTYEVVVGEEAVECQHTRTELRDVNAGTCTVNGYTGDTYCVDCGEELSKGSVITAKGHSYDSGVITKQPTATATGLKVYTCGNCGGTKSETLPMLVITKKAPKVTLTAKRGTSGKISLTGTFSDYANIDSYYEVVKHGFVYYSSSKLGTKTLTVNTSGRTRVNVSSFKSNGSYTYSMTPANKSTTYTVRAFLECVDANGKTVYIYSNPMRVSYNGL